MGKKIPYIGIVTCVLYFIAVFMFLVTKTEIALTIWELFTMIGAPIILFVLLELSNKLKINSSNKNAMLVFMACNCSITGLAHMINMTVTKKLSSEGMNIPNYFKIGYWPSVEMAADYLAWGFFMGLAFLSVGFGVNSKNKQNLVMKILILSCGILCFFGFFGTIVINENLWYFAPIGYGFGTILICIQLIKMIAQTDNGM